MPKILLHSLCSWILLPFPEIDEDIALSSVITEKAFVLLIS